jgi:hypothetical protein
VATLTQLDRCVRAVAKKLEAEKGLAPRAALGKAYAICVKSLQRSGFLESGKRTPTKKGRGRAVELAREPGAKKKKAEFEKMKARARVKRASPAFERLVLAAEKKSRGA